MNSTMRTLLLWMVIFVVVVLLLYTFQAGKAARHELTYNEFLDQLERGNAVPPPLVTDLTAALDRSALQLDSGTRDEDLAARMELFATDLPVDGSDAITNRRTTGLADTLRRIAARLEGVGENQ